MDVLSLFDGMSCGHIAFDKLDIPIDNYYAYEIDKYAIKTTLHNYPDTKELGDVFAENFEKYKDIDFLVGGSPCQAWSVAQSSDRRETTASGVGWELFSQYVRALDEAKPKYFIYENNKSMSRDIYNSISETFGFEPIMINSALLSAQNRQRYYWVGKRNEDYTYSKVEMELPADRGILLRDILDGLTDRDKGRTVMGSTGRTTTREYFKKHQGNMTLEPVKELTEREMDYMVRDHADRRWNFCQRPDEDEKGKCLVANVSKGVPYNVCAEKVIVPLKVTDSSQCFVMPRDDGKQTVSKQYRVYNIEGKGVTLCGNGGGLGAKTGLYAIPIEFDGDIPIKAISGADGKEYHVYRVRSGLIYIKGNEYPIKLSDGYYIIRKLTVSECKRLQTVPEEYEFPVSDSQAYKMLGNGWTCDVIAYLIENALASA